MSRPLPDAAATARGTLSESDSAAFDRLAGALLASSSAPLGPLLRSQLPGTAGVRWLRQENLLPTAGRPSRGKGGRPSTHGHAPGAMATPRWGA